MDDSVGSFQEPDPSTTATPSQDSDSGSKPSSKQATTTPPATKAGASSTPDSTSNPPPSVIVTHASTVIVTAPGDLNVQQPSSTETKAKSSNTAGIAAGAVVGVVAACAIAGGLFFFLRNRKRRAIEEEFHRNSTNTLATNSNMSDARLEPSVMMQRRQSDGSIADNRDYSRRILKVSWTRQNLFKFFEADIVRLQILMVPSLDLDLGWALLNHENESHQSFSTLIPRAPWCRPFVSFPFCKCIFLVGFGVRERGTKMQSQPLTVG